MHLLNNGSTKLAPSKKDVIALGVEIEIRWGELFEAYFKVHKVQLIVPFALESALIRWREMRVRHNKEDYRNTRDEELCTREIADWTLEVNCLLRNQPYVPIEWED